MMRNKKRIIQRRNKVQQEVFEGTVRDMASDGRGIVAMADGRIAFVPGVCIGEHVKCETTGKKGKVTFAKLVELLEHSPHRVVAACAYHGESERHCGGCPWMFMEYTEQLRCKQQRVEQGIHRLHKDFPVEPIWGASNILGYRNRAQFKTDGREIGFVASTTNNLIPIQQCLVLEEKNNITLQQLREQLPNTAWRPRKKERWVTLDIDSDTPAESVSVNQRLPFRQANDEQNLRMQTWLSQCLDDVNVAGKVLELFCGSGNFTQILANRDNVEVVAVEAVEEAITALKDKALDHVSAEVADLYDAQAFKKLCLKHQDATLLFLDPPRAGLQTTDGLIAENSALSDVIYISCDLATLLRDLSYFIEQGFVLKQVQPIDLFPNTPHVEVMVHLSKPKKKKKR